MTPTPLGTTASVRRRGSGAVLVVRPEGMTRVPAGAPVPPARVVRVLGGLPLVQQVAVLTSAGAPVAAGNR